MTRDHNVSEMEIADNRKFTRSSLLRDDFDMRECWDAAVQGYADAQYNIGYMYKNGKGVEQDKAKSFSWYRKAAQLNVSFCYITGAGEEQGNQKAIAALDRLGC